MAKQRPQPKPRSQTTPRRQDPASPQPANAPSGPERRSTYIEAVGLYERGLEAIQRHDYHTALGLLESILSQYPEEKELQERVRLYLNICRRQATPRDAAPKTVDERLYASTLALNTGQYDEALSHLRLVRDEDPDNDHALYMIAVAHAQRGEAALAMAHLERAIALNPENRALARRDPDLEPLSDDEGFKSVVDGPAGGSRAALDRRRSVLKPRTGR